MKTFEVEVTHIIRVTLDETKFTEEWMEDYRKSFNNFNSLQDHAEFLAEKEAEGNLDLDFIEGYGDPSEMGIDFEHVSTYADAQKV